MLAKSEHVVCFIFCAGIGKPKGMRVFSRGDTHPVPESKAFVDYLVPLIYSSEESSKQTGSMNYDSRRNKPNRSGLLNERR